MKQVFTLVILFVVLFTAGCRFSSHKSSAIFPVEKEIFGKEQEEAEEEEEYDGMKEMMMMDMEMTKDVKLGFVPVSRLVNAVDRDNKARMSGSSALARLTALSWIERGPTTNVVGPSNGNTRGPSNNAVTSGRTRAIWVDLNDASNKTVWLGAVSGGLWKTTDITASPADWIPVNDFLDNLAVTSICQSPVNKNIMYFGTGEKTFNVDAVRGGGVWKSTDNGVNWTLLPGTQNFWNVSRVLCDAAGNLYVATVGSGSGIQRSTDGGVTWTNITPTLPAGTSTRVTEMRLSSTGRLHIVCGYYNTSVAAAGHFFTDNPATVTGATWLTPITTYPTQYNVELTVVGNTLYALPANSSYQTPTVYKSTDGGLNWNALPQNLGGGSEPTINAGQGWYDLAIGADPANPDIVIAGGLNFYRSENGGASWTQISRWVGTSLNYVHADHHTVVWNGSQVLLGTDGGIFYSNNNGASFVDRNIGVRTKQFYACAIHPTQTNYFLAGAQDNGTHQFTSAGLGGSIEVLGGDGGFVHIDEDEPQFQFGSTTNGNYRRSINNGVSWSGVTNNLSGLGQFINPTDYDDKNNRMYTSAGNGGSGTFIRWDNPQSGSTFTQVSIGGGTTSGITSVKVSPYTNNRVFFGSSQARVVRVDNANLNFPATVNISGSNFPGSGNTVSCVNIGTSDQFLIASFSNYGVGHVYVTTTGGGTAGWENISGNLPDVPVRWALFYPEDNDKAIIATEMGIFETDDINGSSTVWVRNASFPVVRTNMLQYRQTDRTLLAATHGRGLWTTQLPLAVPYIRFASSYTYTSTAESTTFSGSVCRSYKDITVPMRIDAAPTGNATVTVSVQAGGSATQGVDYEVTTNGSFTTPSNTLTFANGSTANQTITVRVYNDAEMEAAESFVITYAVSGSTNAIAAPSSQVFTVNISDDDVAASPALFSGNFDIGQSQTTLTSNSPFRADRSKFRVQYLFTASELSSAGIYAAGYIKSMTINVTTKNSSQPYTGFTISMTNTTATNLSTGFTGGLLTQVYSANYSSVSGTNLFTFTTPFYWDGVSNLLVNICYDKTTTEAVPDEVEATSAPLGTNIRASTWSDAVSTTGCSLNAAFISDSRIITTFNASSGNPIATTAGVNRSEFVGGTGTYNFFSTFDIIGSITEASANFDCVNMSVAAAGNTWQTFVAGPRSQKIVSVSYTGAGTYKLGLYFTAAELGGKDPSLVRIAGTTAATIGAANSGNSQVYATTYIPFGTGYFYTAAVSGPGLFFLAEANITPVRNTSRTENFVKLLQNPVGSAIPLQVGNPTRVNVEATLFTNSGQVLQRWNLGRADGNYQLSLGKATMPAGVYVLRVDAGNKTQSFKVTKQ